MGGCNINNYGQKATNYVTCGESFALRGYRTLPQWLIY